MATLFWAGKTFAPNLCVRVGSTEVNIQDYLQDAFIGAYGALADEVGAMDACLGFETLNEPHRGYINLHSWSRWKCAPLLTRRNRLAHRPLSQSFAGYGPR